MLIKISKIIILALFINIKVSADMDTSRVFKDSKGKKFVMIANSSQTCLKGKESINYTLFIADTKDIYGCALTYHYAMKKNKRGNFNTDKLIRYSRSSDDICKEKLEKLLEKVKKLGFKCTFSGIG